MSEAADQIACLQKLGRAFGTEVTRWPERGRRGFKQSKGEVLGGQEGEDYSETADASGRGEDGDIADDLEQRGVRLHPHAVPLCGIVEGKNGTISEKAAGQGKGVPPAALIEHSAIISLGPDKAPMVSTFASDGTNILWEPAKGWQYTGTISFRSLALDVSASSFAVPRPPNSRRGRDRKEHFVRVQPGQRPGRTYQAQRLAGASLREPEVSRNEVEAHQAQAGHRIEERRDASHYMYRRGLHDVDFTTAERVRAHLEQSRQVSDGVGASSSASHTTGYPVSSPAALLAFVRRGARPEGGPYRGSDSRDTQKSDAPAAVSSVTRPLRPTCVVAHPKEPRFAAGVGNGQLGVYCYFCIPGQRKTEFHQTHVCDAPCAKGGESDVATSLHLPTTPLAKDGSLGKHSLLAGFASGRVVAFRIVIPMAARRNLEDHEDDEHEESQHTEGALLASAPLLLDFFPGGPDSRTGAVVSICWHSAGIISVTAGGSVVCSDVSGSTIWSIPVGACSSSAVAATDISIDMEQLAIADQRHLYIWQYPSQTRLSVLDPCSFGVLHKPSPALLLRYLPLGRRLISVHAVRGSVLIWDAETLALQRECGVQRTLRHYSEATNATWCSRTRVLLIFGTHGGVEARVDQARPTEEDYFQMLHRQTHQVVLMNAADRWQWGQVEQ